MNGNMWNLITELEVVRILILHVNMRIWMYSLKFIMLLWRQEIAIYGWIT